MAMNREMVRILEEVCDQYLGSGSTAYDRREREVEVAMIKERIESGYLDSDAMTLINQMSSAYVKIKKNDSKSTKRVSGLLTAVNMMNIKRLSSGMNIQFSSLRPRTLETTESFKRVSQHLEKLFLECFEMTEPNNATMPFIEELKSLEVPDSYEIPWFITENPKTNNDKINCKYTDKIINGCVFLDMPSTSKIISELILREDGHARYSGIRSMHLMVELFNLMSERIMDCDQISDFHKQRYKDGLEKFTDSMSWATEDCNDYTIDDMTGLYVMTTSNMIMQINHSLLLSRNWSHLSKMNLMPSEITVHVSHQGLVNRTAIDGFLVSISSLWITFETYTQCVKARGDINKFGKFIYGELDSLWQGIYSLE